MKQENITDETYKYLHDGWDRKPINGDYKQQFRDEHRLEVIASKKQKLIDKAWEQEYAATHTENDPDLAIYSEPQYFFAADPKKFPEDLKDIPTEM